VRSQLNARSLARQCAFSFRGKTLRMRELAVVLTLTACAACASSGRKGAPTPTPNRNEISVVVFNGRTAQVPFTVIVGDSVIVDTIAPLMRMVPPMAMSAAIPMRPGTYRVLVVDGARAKIYESKIRIPSDRARIEISFVDSKSIVEVVYGERIYQ
jgi:hypothetical protein